MEEVPIEEYEEIVDHDDDVEIIEVVEESVAEWYSVVEEEEEVGPSYSSEEAWIVEDEIVEEMEEVVVNEEEQEEIIEEVQTVQPKGKEKEVTAKKKELQIVNRVVRPRKYRLPNALLYISKLKSLNPKTYKYYNKK